jgi:hypothetical protein
MVVDFQTYFPRSRFVYLMLKADAQIDDEDLCRRKEVTRKPAAGIKRGRDEEETETEAEFFRRLVREWDHAGLFPTFKVLVDARFYIQLAMNQDKAAFRDVAVAVQEFRKLITKAEKALYWGDSVGVSNVVVGELFDFLLSYQQLIIIFNLQCNQN